MPAAGCTIVVERLGDALYRARCTLYPDCQAVAATEEAARQAVEEAIARILRERDEAFTPRSRGARGNEGVL